MTELGMTFLWITKVVLTHTLKPPDSKLLTRPWKGRSSTLEIIISTRSKHVDNVAGLQGAGLVLHAAAHHEAVTRAGVERFAGARDPQMAGDDVDNLLMGMTVSSANPPFLHAMLCQEQFFVVGADQARQTGLWMAPRGLRTGH